MLKLNRTERLLPIAEKQDDRTDAYRDLFPDLYHVWNELDDLRIAVHSASDAPTREEYDDLEKELEEVESDRDQEIRLRRETLDTCGYIASRLSHIMDRLPDGPLRDQLDYLWHKTPKPS